MTQCGLMARTGRLQVGNVMKVVAMLLMFVVGGCQATPEDSTAGQLAKIVSQLQSQVLALEEARAQDKATILVLQEKLHLHFGFPSYPEILDDDETNALTSTTESPPLIPGLTLSSALPSSGATRSSSSLDQRNLSVEEELRRKSRTIRVLERERQSLDRLDSELRELKADLSEVVRVKERDMRVTAEVADFRLEADSLREELLRLRREMEEVRARQEEHATVARQARAGQLTTRWLQKTVEDLRHEMSEMASAVNVSVALGQRQSVEATLGLIRSDLGALRHRLDGVHVGQERDAAWVAQLRQDLAELRLRVQEMAAGHETLKQQVLNMKEDLLLQISQTNEKKSHQRSLIGGSTAHSPRIRPRDVALEKQIADKGAHRLRHHGHWQAEIEELQNSVKNLEYLESMTRQEVRDISQNQSSLEMRLANVVLLSTRLTNESAHLYVEQSATHREVELIQRQMEQGEREARRITSKVNNITESGIKKLHASTVQLFETLEKLENNYDKTLADIRKEMSKMEFNLAQAHSTIVELREEQANDDQSLKSIKNDVRRLQMEARRDHFRLLAVQSDVVNRTLQNCKHENSETVREMKLSILESRIASLSAQIDGERQEVDVLHEQMKEKVDSSVLAGWERTQHRMREVVLNLTEEIPKMKKAEKGVEKEISKFVNQLPKDCSMMGDSIGGDHAYKSGVYLIRSPLTSASVEQQQRAIKVYCDMDTSGGYWTVLQRRRDGGQNFNQNWIRYKGGFGKVDGDFWLGNEIIHQLTTTDDYILRLDLWDAAGRYKFVEYDTFRVLQESDNYRLAIAGYHGNASDALNYHNGMAFSTPDRDNDASETTHCGQFYDSGWWYNHCQYVNINGRYNTGVTWYDIDGQEWSELTRVEMKMKPRRLVPSFSPTSSSSNKSD